MATRHISTIYTSYCTPTHLFKKEVGQQDIPASAVPSLAAASPVLSAKFFSKDINNKISQFHTYHFRRDNEEDSNVSCQKGQKDKDE